MIRNLDLIRSALKDMEESEGFVFNKIDVEGYEEEVINNHLILMEEAGLITGEFYYAESGHIYGYSLRLTNAGYEYLALASNQSLWEKIKNKFKDKAFDISIDLSKQLLFRGAEEILK